MAKKPFPIYKAYKDMRKYKVLSYYEYVMVSSKDYTQHSISKVYDSEMTRLIIEDDKTLTDITQEEFQEDFDWTLRILALFR